MSGGYSADFPGDTSRVAVLCENLPVTWSSAGAPDVPICMSFTDTARLIVPLLETIAKTSVGFLSVGIFHLNLL